MIFAPASMAILAATVCVGIGLVRAGLAATSPVLDRVLDTGLKQEPGRNGPGPKRQGPLKQGNFLM